MSEENNDGKKQRAVILFSGGLDSTTILAYAKNKDFDCYALSFDYGQRHDSELNAAKKITRKFHVSEHKFIKIPLDLIGGSSLVRSSVNLEEEKYTDIPNTYVPARNLIFLSIALAWAETLKAYDIFIGVNAVDYSGYPDCRPEFIKSFQEVVKLATKEGTIGSNFKINTPLINLSKHEIIELGDSLGVDYSLTISCYQASDEGHACGKCEACKLRAQGFAKSNIKDPTIYK
tara:strand:- start:186 stop:881 length:696 start_codon:yes stop_codon:yes gene_type:complete